MWLLQIGFIGFRDFNVISRLCWTVDGAQVLVLQYLNAEFVLHAVPDPIVVLVDHFLMLVCELY